MANLYGPEHPSIGRIYDQLDYLVKIKMTAPSARFSQPLAREQLSELIETAFWASLNSDEGRPTKVRIAVAAPEEFPDALKLESPASFDERQISKLAPAVPPPGCLLVSNAADKWNIWGFGRARPGSWVATVTIELLGAGLLAVGIGPFQPFAVLRGRSSPIVAGNPGQLVDYFRRILQKELSGRDLLEQQALWHECYALADLARMILAHGHGGAILIVPSETGDWVKSLNPFPYRFSTPDTIIRDIIRQDLKSSSEQGEMLLRVSEANIPEELKQLALGAASTSRGWAVWIEAVRVIAPLAAVDGALVLNRGLGVLGFGAKISVAPKIWWWSTEPKVNMVFLPDSTPIPSTLEQTGGTRHQSAARFVAANPDSVAVVISQDRRVSLMYWNREAKAVIDLRNIEWLM